jgi:hypothetical protein
VASATSKLLHRDSAECFPFVGLAIELSIAGSHAAEGAGFQYPPPKLLLASDCGENFGALRGGPSKQNSYRSNSYQFNGDP